MDQKPLKVGFLHESVIESAACRLIGTYERQYDLNGNGAIPADAILEGVLDLTFEFDDLQSQYPGGEVLGATMVGEKKVVIDQSLDPFENPSKSGRYVFTVAHEIGHWEMHRPLILAREAQLAMMAVSGVPSYLCRSTMRKEPAEIQADKFAGYLLMPKERVLAAWRDLHGHLTAYIATEELDELRAMWGDEFPVVEVAKTMAQRFQVSGQAMQYRLEKLGLVLTDRPEPDLFSGGMK